MRKWVGGLIGVALFVAGVGVGRGWSARSANVPTEQPPPVVAHAKPSLEDDHQSLQGWWIQGRVGKLIHFYHGTLWIYDLHADFKSRAWLVFDLAERDGGRYMMHLEDHDRPQTAIPAYRYQFVGDRLELESLSDRSWNQGEPIWELNGSWDRLNLPPETPSP